MKARGNLPACPNCEGQNMRGQTGGGANEGTIPLRYYVCLDCDFHGVTFEGWLPPTASINGLDEHRRARNRVYQQRRRGGKRGDKPRAGGRISSDTIVYYVAIEPGQLEPGLAKRIDKIKEANGVQPFTDNEPTQAVPNTRHGWDKQKLVALAMMDEGFGTVQIARMTGVPTYQVHRWRTNTRDAEDTPMPRKDVA